MSRSLKEPVGPFRTESTSFSKGKERPIEITLFPKYVEVRVVGQKDLRFHVGYEAIVNHGAAAEISHRIKRGAV